jgi:DNA processing protein
MAEYFGRELSLAGVTVVSGLARGVDTRAHEAALGAGGRTIAVTGTGPDLCYPPENRRLAARIAAGGAVLSEFPPGTGPEPGNFPRRNRIISGISLGTVVVESDVDGGAMITASMALDQDREVFAVPGPAHSRRSRGCHALIRDGRAKLVAAVPEILSEISQGIPGGCPARGSSPSLPAPLPPEERTVYDLVGADPVHVDGLAAGSGLAVPDLLVRLLSLEMKGLVRQLPGKYFLRPP